MCDNKCQLEWALVSAIIIVGNYPRLPIQYERRMKPRNERRRMRTRGRGDGRAIRRAAEEDAINYRIVDAVVSSQLPAVYHSIDTVLGHQPDFGPRSQLLTVGSRFASLTELTYRLSSIAAGSMESAACVTERGWDRARRSVNRRQMEGIILSISCETIQ